MTVQEIKLEAIQAFGATKVCEDYGLDEYLEAGCYMVLASCLTFFFGEDNQSEPK